MSDLFRMNVESTQKVELKKYCKMENVPLSVLLYVDKPKRTMKLRLESLAYHLLQIVDKRLNVMIDRLSAKVEHNSMVQGRLS